MKQLLFDLNLALFSEWSFTVMTLYLGFNLINRGAVQNVLLHTKIGPFVFFSFALLL